MDGGGPAQQARPNLQVQNLIRPEQVAKLPQLSAQQKQATEKRVSQFWEIIHANSNNQNDPKYLQASQGLAQLSSTLMQSMKAYNMQKRQQQQAQGAPQNAQGAQNQPANPAQPQSNGQAPNQQTNAAQAFQQLLPDIQTKVRSLNFEYPPAMVKGTSAADTWIMEAQLRYGQAIQRAQMASNKKRELQRAAQLRQSQGSPLSADEQKGFNSKIAACDNAIKDSQNFMDKFKDQQQSFKREKAEAAQQTQQRMMREGVPGQPGVTSDAAHGDNNTSAPQMSQGGMQGPQPHSISSAQAAARANSTNTNNNVPQPQPVSSTVTGSQPTPIDQAQAGFNSNSSMNQMAQPMSRPSTAAGPPATAHPSTNMQASHAHPASAVNPHPINNAINGMKGHPPAIPKTLSVSEPKPVPMPPSRPTLNGGANVGLPGQVAQPALTTFPGYVLEQSADGHLVSKKKLQELVREVMGPNSEEMLTPEAEEVSETITSYDCQAIANIHNRSL